MRPAADINVTPLIDVLLVLLIIFMVITPLTPKDWMRWFRNRLRISSNKSASMTVPSCLRCSAGADKPALKINQDDVTWENLEGRLNDIFKTRAEKVMFVKADTDLALRRCAQVIDIAHGRRRRKVGLITAKIEAGE